MSLPLRLRKAKALVSQSSQTKSDPSNAEGKADASPPFPFARYISVTGVHVCLLVFTALYLPRTDLSFLISLSPFQRRHVDTGGSQDAPSDAMTLLTSNPTQTVAWMCLGTFIIQAWWSNWLKTWSVEAREAATGKQDAAELTKQKMRRRFLNDLWTFKGAFAATAIVSVAFHVVLVFFGAPIASHVFQTYYLALLLALLTIWTPAYALGPPTMGSNTESLLIRLTWIRLFAELSPRTPLERTMVYPAIGAMLGCWSGAIPIGLDWDRPWQAWPLTPAFGAIFGYIAGSLTALVTSVVTWLAETDIISSQVPAKKQKGKQR
ncbi:uncharacterized protein LAESUDRAFT_665530 [Laetiporus sulphureus 93-53]|uniref:PIG-F-domain-containing protein n=1 Tax=Laetiporus sulphureus 93-53 TaxID=1314785 RepID=A0A165BC85_9APHY|nr:uncharacterized protein LAESUDRAFT_665530 [Laetiporus sulphureus 93-53]KZT00720.1 hypothetical protein LAESUDRAFT_665530 [Laetiporus sulphureus 93-53]